MVRKKKKQDMSFTPFFSKLNFIPSFLTLLLLSTQGSITEAMRDGLQLPSGHVYLLHHGILHRLQWGYLCQHGAFSFSSDLSVPSDGSYTFPSSFSICEEFSAFS